MVKFFFSFVHPSIQPNNSDHIENHPALHQQYLWVGSSPPPPNYNPDYHILEYESIIPRQSSSFYNETIDDDGHSDDHHHNHNHHDDHDHNNYPFRSSSTQSSSPKMILKVKRKKNSDKREQLPSEEICETKEKWEQVCVIIYVIYDLSTYLSYLLISDYRYT